jgi:DNA-binding winged helix-turn-helix (wHTH) protein
MFWQSKTSYEFGRFRMDTRERLLLCDGEVVALTPKVFDILLVLVQNSGHILSKEEVMKVVWPDAAVEEGS